MSYQVLLSQKAEKSLQKMDKGVARLITSWIIKNLYSVENPRIHGKELKSNLKGLWRYQVGDYRLIAEIKNRELLIFMIEIGYRREIYEE
ncbi:addiction module toxin RelE [Fusobacterium necrophorum subsp. funduliforme]|uniref:Addiction module toxin, RelE/StbE family n=2 Tax=Fusobacterium necrophorum TaxID=859 RepID=A0AAN3VVN0_9FUSO|nr:type II toxin-antitoxin system RelE/ParE family toxin [Fusobacterium necrophorum]AYV94475.1 type II toxin-antitoxin system RelE/ParE family toxin [Fusobacterium necrophorum subsp. funduliforme]EFS22452.1 addiction module toxin, RelE/StbE family [Fusobacterium necrophorum D12]EJU17561.1 addiction module toxin, RelE/StbE family [Fusobacterium necrophorum subsp. funduliforme Fnf 1007]KYL02578.1 addiction module toxin RelE [Fusobacterium necrophorum subsp. funduliforme]KYL04176.1 addiction modu